MDFELTDRQIQVRARAREFARLEFDPQKIREWDRTHAFPKEIWRKACQARENHRPRGFSVG